MPFLSMTGKQKVALAIVLLMGLLMSLQLTYWSYIKQGTASIAEQSNKQIDELVLFLESALARYENVPAVIAQNSKLLDGLLEQKNTTKIATLNNYLEELKDVTLASEIYLTDAQGVAIAASNAGQKNSFINQDYSFRPYFIDAISGKQGRYYAVGASSDKRGFYFSNPVYHQQKVLGTVVVKVDIGVIEQQSSGIAIASQYEFIISDPDHIVFLTSFEHWRFKSMTPLSQSKRYALNASKRYASRQVNELNTQPEFMFSAPKTPQIIEVSHLDKKHKYLEIHQLMPKANWTVHIFSPLAPLSDALPPILLLTATLYLLFAVFVLYAIERRKNHMRMKHAKEELEQRVKARTNELEKINTELNNTQGELIQAAKLTVIGHLSASINHELNQPLAALRSYAQNTQTFLSRQMYDQVKNNLGIMIELTDRLADIIGQFKNFTRKSTDNETATDINQCINDAITIIKPELAKQHIQLETHLCDDFCQVWGDKTKLQQVLVNIMTNAINAMQNSHTKKLIITVSVNKVLHVSIQDTGPGVQTANMSKIFEPYYTTHERQGLGLGLSISQRIIEAMKGDITVENVPESGAIFLITLPIYTLEGAPIEPN